MQTENTITFHLPREDVLALRRLLTDAERELERLEDSATIKFGPDSWTAKNYTAELRRCRDLQRFVQTLC
jgi:hypothetical protein